MHATSGFGAYNAVRELTAFTGRTHTASSFWITQDG